MALLPTRTMSLRKSAGQEGSIVVRISMIETHFYANCRAAVSREAEKLGKDQSIVIARMTAFEFR